MRYLCLLVAAPGAGPDGPARGWEYGYPEVGTRRRRASLADGSAEATWTENGIRRSAPLPAPPAE